MTGWIWNVQITCPGKERYEREAGGLASLYGELLGMQRIDIGYIKLTKGEGVLPEIGFEGDGGAGDARPQWPDPEYPQQLHLDIEVGDLDAAERVALRWGATRLQDNGEYRVYEDPVGHPFCLYLDSTLTDGPLPGRLARVVFDCFSPRALARFYEELLDMRIRVLDSLGRVVISGEPRRLSVTDDAGRTFDVTIDPRRPMLAFQHVARFRPSRWPDPHHPEQLHLDLGFDDPQAALSLMEELGAIRLREFPHRSVYADPAAHPFCAPPTDTAHAATY